MKTTSFRFILAALAATAALTGCVQEITSPSFENDKVNPEGSRVIAVSFAAQPQTKTYLDKDGLQPKFNDGDSVLISNGEVADTCRVSVDDKTGAATISTNLEGCLVAIYPAKFAESDGDITIPSVQSGKFSDANICYAEMEGEDESSLQFVNYSAILKFYVDESIGVTSLKITSSGKKIAKDSYTIIVKAPEDKTLADVTDDPEKRICYVALDCGKDLFSNQLAFEIETTTQGTVTRAPTNTGKVRIGYMYNAFIPYYIEVNGQKWAYCNIGAFLPEEPGEYFSWAEVKGHKADTTKQIEDGFRKGAFATDFTAFSEIAKTDSRYSANWNSSAGFGHCNAPYAKTDVGGYTKYSISALNTLEPADDAATANWGDKWRMPTRKEYEDLLENPNTSWLNSYNSSGQSGLAFQNEDNQLFFPAAGFGVSECDLMVRSIAENDIYYNVGGFWSSSVASSGNEAYAMNFFVGVESSVENASRENGFPIRPIYVAPAPTPTEPDYVEMKMGTGDDAYTLKWATKNLGATEVATDYRCYGDYYQWGSLDKLYTSITWTDNTTGSFVGLKEGGFAETNPTYKDDADLSDATNDVVMKTYPGTGWRMPTSQEFQDLYDACVGTDGYDKTTKPTTGKPTYNGVYWCDSYDGVSGCLFYDGTNVLFFPAACYGGESDPLINAGPGGNYWSSTLYSDLPDGAYCLSFFNNDVYPQYETYRFYGLSVRPVCPVSE